MSAAPAIRKDKGRGGPFPGILDTIGNTPLFRLEDGIFAK